jgi:hypothetical protein
VGLGGGPNEWDDYEWVRLAALPRAAGEALAESMVGWLRANPLWRTGRRRRVLLVDLDNLRADPRRWRARMAVVVELAREADHVVLAGQVGAVRRARPHLAEFADQARPVANGSDLADQVLLDAVADLDPGPVQVLVLSNDGIFGALAGRGPLLVLSPGRDALSDRLDSAADLVVDLVDLETEAAAASHPSRPAGRRPRTKAVQAAY